MWLELQGFPVLRRNKEWKANGLLVHKDIISLNARTRWVGLSDSEWARIRSVRNQWQKLNGIETLAAVVQRIQLLRKLHRLNWPDLSTANKFYRWKKKAETKGSYLDDFIMDQARIISREPVLLRTGLSRAENEEIRFALFKDKTMGQRARDLRFLTGYSIVKAKAALRMKKNSDTLENLEADILEKFEQPNFIPRMGDLYDVDPVVLLEGISEPEISQLTLNRAIRVLRLARGIKQQELAPRIGITQQALSQYELDSIPGANVQLALIRELGQSLKAVFTPEKFEEARERRRARINRASAETTESQNAEPGSALFILSESHKGAASATLAQGGEELFGTRDSGLGTRGTSFNESRIPIHEPRSTE